LALANTAAALSQYWLRLLIIGIAEPQLQRQQTALPKPHCHQHTAHELQAGVSQHDVPEF